MSNRATAFIGYTLRVRVDLVNGAVENMAGMPFTYDAIATDSNLGTLSLELLDKRTGMAVDLTGATVTTTLVDETTGELIANAGTGTVNAINPGIVDYVISAQNAAKIVADSTWLVEWKITTPSGRVFRIAEPCRLPVRRKL